MHCGVAIGAYMQPRSGAADHCGLRPRVRPTGIRRMASLHIFGGAATLPRCTLCRPILHSEPTMHTEDNPAVKGIAL